MEMDSFFDRLGYRDVAKAIDHSLLRPEYGDTEIEAGCRLAVEYDVASVCCQPDDVRRAAELVRGTDVFVSATVGFPHGGHRTDTKVFEAERAMDDGAVELDMVLDLGALMSGRDDDVRTDIEAVVEVAHRRGALVKVILENAYLTDDQKVRGCRLAEAAGAEFVKTSTGYAATGATLEDLALMRRTVSSHVQIKAAGGVRTLDQLLAVLELGVSRVGATTTAHMLDDFKARKRRSVAAVTGR
jgi:deoxyribose-phosphate aldolase